MRLQKIILSIALGFITVLFARCNWNDSNFSKDNYLKTTAVKDSLYNETYLIRSRSTDIERYSQYITDSVNFRKYVCTHDFGEWLYGEVGKNDVLTIYKVKGNLLSGKQMTFDTILLTTYHIDELKKEGIFE